jgi:hypothetical protein
MKTDLIFRFLKPAALLLLGSGLFLGSPAVAEENTKTPAEVLLGEIKTTPYPARADLRRKLQEAEVRFATNMTEWNARKNQLPEKEKAAAAVDLKELARLRELLKQKVDSVEFAEEATWSSAKYDLYVALQNAIAVHKKLMARFSA